MSDALILPMMMYGKFRRVRAKRDEDGNTVVKKMGANNRAIYENEKYWLYHVESKGDSGVYPSVNAIYTRMAKGRQRLTAPAQKLFTRWQAEARDWVERNKWACSQEQKVIVELVAYFPNDKIRRDINNVFKLMMDAFNGIIYDDDEYALPRVIDFHKVAPGEKPYFEVRFRLKESE